MAKELIYSTALGIEAKIGNIATHVKVLAGSYNTMGGKSENDSYFFLKSMDEVAKNTAFQHKTWGFIEFSKEAYSLYNEPLTKNQTLSWVKEPQELRFNEIDITERADLFWLYTKLKDTRKDMIAISHTPQGQYTYPANMIAMISPMIDNDNNLIGGVGVNIEGGVLSAMLEYLKQSGADKAYIINQDDKVVALFKGTVYRSDKEW